MLSEMRMENKVIPRIRTGSRKSVKGCNKVDHGGDKIGFQKIILSTMSKAGWKQVGLTTGG